MSIFSVGDSMGRKKSLKTSNEATMFFRMSKVLELRTNLQLSAPNPEQSIAKQPIAEK
jgi:hypothetical protein